MIKPNQIAPLTFEEHLKRLIELQSLRTSLWQDEIEIRVETGKLDHFFFRPLSDIHTGGMGVNTAELVQHLHDISTYPIYTSINGDEMNMYMPAKIPSGMVGDVLTPDDQMAMMRRFYEEYAEKILTITQDNSHPGWINQTTGIEPKRILSEGLNIPLLKNGGVLNLYVNAIHYRILMFHEIGQYKSSLNITNAHKRMLDMRLDADVVIAGHTHIGDMEKPVKREGKPYLIQLGTFKTGDDYGDRKGLSPKPQVFFPTLFFNGRKKNVEAIEDRETAIDIICALSKGSI